MFAVIKKNKTFLIFLFLFSFLIRFVVFALILSKNQNYWTYDSRVYHEVALQISDGNGISNLNKSPHFHRVPGYSLFLATCYNFFNLNLKNALWIQVFLASSIPLLIFFLSLVFFPTNILLAKLASSYSAIHLGFVLFSGMAMAESFFCLFFFIFLIFFLPNWNLFFCKNLFEKLSYKKLFFAGIFLGLASLIRPVGQYLIIVSILVLFFSNFKFRKKIKSSLVLFFGWLLVVFGWLLRNYILTGCIFFHTLPGIHFLKHSAARVAMDIYGCSHNQALRKLSSELEVNSLEKEKKLKRKLNDIEQCNLAENVSLKYLKKDLPLTLKHCFINMFKTCFSLYSAEILYIESGGKLPHYEKNKTLWNSFRRFLCPNVSSKWVVFLIYLEIFLFLFILIGFAGFIINSFFVKNHLCLLFKVLPFMGLLVVLSLACGFARLRLPIEPFLIIFSFKFWMSLFRKSRDSYE